MTKVILPELGEGIDKAIVSYWYHKEGDKVKEKEDLVELTTDKATFNLPSPCNGVLVNILCPEGQTVHIGEALAEIDENG
ncbi:MAG: biotin attachment protein [Candidatus Omnitrophica bacterium]|nr:biotin attachment protein [Candidatus Omnitrophota bacterium]MCM8770732.1 biotin attachment protein [Candidatus Omnitrophota bacterium]